MKWELIDIKQETNHPFLNYYTLTYKVTENNDEIKTYNYYLASRRKIDNLVAKTNDYSKSDGVIIPCYFIDPKTNLLSIIVTKQFRPALNTYVYSFPAGLVDNNEDLIETVKREAKEEVGAILDETEVLATCSPTSSGLSDELNSIVLGHVKILEYNHLEEFEDINYQIVPLKNAEEFFESHFSALQIKIIVKYLLLRFKGQY